MAEGGEDDKEGQKGGKGEGAAVRSAESAAGQQAAAHGNLVEKTAAEVLKYCLAACSAAGLDSAG